MHDPGFRQQFMAQHRHTLERRARRWRRSWTRDERPVEAEVVIRLHAVPDLVTA